MRSHLTWMATAAALGLTAGHSLAQAPPAAQPSRPPIETTKVEGTDNVYIFRNVNHQSIFIVTKAGVIATDPVAYGRPTGGQSYVDEIKKVTNQPIKYLIYSHHHYDHIAGGKAFKDAGARVIAHKRAKERLDAIKDPHTVPVGRGRDRCRPHHHARRHDGGAQVCRHQSLRLDAGAAAAEGEADLRRRSHSRGLGAGARHDRLLSDGIGGLDQEHPGHGLGAHDPGPSGGRAAARPAPSRTPRTSSSSCRYASAEVQKAAREGKCWDAVEKDLKLPKYESWPGYANNLPFVLRRYCGLWGRGT